MMAEATLMGKRAHGWERSELTIIPPEPTNDPHFAVKPQYEYGPHNANEDGTEDDDGGSTTFGILKI